MIRDLKVQISQEWTATPTRSEESGRAALEAWDSSVSSRNDTDFGGFGEVMWVDALL